MNTEGVSWESIVRKDGGELRTAELKKGISSRENCGWRTFMGKLEM